MTFGPAGAEVLRSATVGSGDSERSYTGTLINDLIEMVEDCPACEGSGEVSDGRDTDGTFRESVSCPCHKCKGTGERQ